MVDNVMDMIRVILVFKQKEMKKGKHRRILK